MDAAEEEYFPVEAAQAVEQAIDKRSTLAMSWLETRLYEEVYESLSKYMNRVDLVYALGELRQNFLSGFSTTTTENLHRVCNRCRLCEGLKESAVNPSWNVVDPD